MTVGTVFDTVSARRAGDSAIVVLGHLDGQAEPVVIAELDDFDARMLATTLAALIERRPRLKVAS